MPNSPWPVLVGANVLWNGTPFVVAGCNNRGTLRLAPMHSCQGDALNTTLVAASDVLIRWRWNMRPAVALEGELCAYAAKLLNTLCPGRGSVGALAPRERSALGAIVSEGSFATLSREEQAALVGDNTYGGLPPAPVKAVTSFLETEVRGSTTLGLAARCDFVGMLIRAVCELFHLGYKCNMEMCQRLRVALMAAQDACADAGAGRATVGKVAAAAETAVVAAPSFDMLWAADAGTDDEEDINDRPTKCPRV